jgi:hypothetical protein
MEFEFENRVTNLLDAMAGTVEWYYWCIMKNSITEPFCV